MTLDREGLLELAPPARQEKLSEFLSDQLSRVLRIPVSELDEHQPLNNLGIDSLMAVELRNHVQSGLGMVIPVARLLQSPSIAQLSEFLADQLMESGAAAVVSEPEQCNAQPSLANGEPSASETLARIDELSDEEVEMMLGEMLNPTEMTE